MLNLVSLLVAAALVSHQCSFEATARQIEDKKFELDNSLKPNAIPASRHRVRTYVTLQPPPATIHHLLGTTSILDCKIMGHPAPSVAWMKNGELISDFEEDANEILNIHPSSYAVLVSKLVLTSPANGDVYTCVATAGSHQKTASTTVLTIEGVDTSDVLEQLFSVPAAPIITAHYDSVLQSIGTSALLPCRVSSAAAADVYWLDRHGELVGYDHPTLKVLPSGDLMIPKLAWDHMGSYTCIAKNMYGKDSVDTFLYPIKSGKCKFFC